MGMLAIAAAMAGAQILSGVLGEATSGGGQPGSTTQHKALSPEQEQLLQDLVGQIQIGEGVEAYPGERVADASGFQEKSYGMLEDMLGQPSPYEDVLASYGEEKDILGDLMEKREPTEFDSAALRDYFQKTFTDPSMKSFQNEQVANILEPYISRGGMRSGAAKRALSGGAADLLASLAGKESELLFRGEEAHKTRETEMEMQDMMRRTGLFPEYRQFAQMGEAGRFKKAELEDRRSIDQLGYLSTLGGEQRGIESEELLSEMQKYQEEQAYNNPWLQYLQGALQTKVFDTQVTPATPDRPYGKISEWF